MDRPTDRPTLTVRPATPRRSPFWALALLAAGAVGGIAAGTAALVRAPEAPARAMAALPAPADLDHAYHAFDAFRDQPQQGGSSSTAAVALPQDGNRL